MIESIGFERPVWFNQIKEFKNALKHQQKWNISQKRVGFPKNVQQHIELIDWFDWIIWFIIELIESVHLYLATWLNWLIYSSYTDSWCLAQYVFTFCHDWVDWFGMSRIQVCSHHVCNQTFPLFNPKNFHLHRVVLVAYLKQSEGGGRGVGRAGAAAPSYRARGQIYHSAP